MFLCFYVYFCAASCVVNDDDDNAEILAIRLILILCTTVTLQNKSSLWRFKLLVLSTPQLFEQRRVFCFGLWLYSRVVVFCILIRANNDD